jgi:hypothetical protein
VVVHVALCAAWSAIVTVALVAVELVTEQTVDGPPPNVIAKPELALATTVKLLLSIAVAGAGVVTVMLWLAGVALVDSLTFAAAE